MWVRVRIPGVGEWSQPAEKPLREDVGEHLVPDSGHEVPYRDHPEPPDEARPIQGIQDAAAAADEQQGEDPPPPGVRVKKIPKGA
jgi:hypothetical protein